MAAYKKVRNTWIKNEDGNYTEPAVTLWTVLIGVVLALLTVGVIWLLFVLVGIVGMA